MERVLHDWRWTLNRPQHIPKLNLFLVTGRSFLFAAPQPLRPPRLFGLLRNTDIICVCWSLKAAAYLETLHRHQGKGAQALMGRLTQGDHQARLKEVLTTVKDRCTGWGDPFGGGSLRTFECLFVCWLIDLFFLWWVGCWFWAFVQGNCWQNLGFGFDRMGLTFLLSFPNLYCFKSCILQIKVRCIHNVSWRYGIDTVPTAQPYSRESSALSHCVSRRHFFRCRASTSRMLRRSRRNLG